MSTVRNIGDYRVFKGQEAPAPQKDKANARGVDFTIHGEHGDYEGDIIHVDEKGERTGKQFGYYWLDDPEVNPMYQWQYDVMLDEGYRIVRAYRAGEGQPGKGLEFRANKYRVLPDGRVTKAGKMLLAIPAELLDARDEDEKNRRAVQTYLDQNAAPIHELAERAGLASYQTRAGKTEEVARARK